MRVKSYLGDREEKQLALMETYDKPIDVNSVLRRMNPDEFLYGYAVKDYLDTCKESTSRCSSDRFKALEEIMNYVPSVRLRGHQQYCINELAAYCRKNIKELIGKLNEDVNKEYQEVALAFVKAFIDTPPEEKDKGDPIEKNRVVKAFSVLKKNSNWAKKLEDEEFRSKLTQAFKHYRKFEDFLTSRLQVKNNLSVKKMNEMNDSFKNAWSSEISDELILEATKDMDRFLESTWTLVSFEKALRTIE